MRKKCVKRLFKYLAQAGVDPAAEVRRLAAEDGVQVLNQVLAIGLEGEDVSGLR